MDGIVCVLSAKRRALVEEEPDLLAEVIEARHGEPIPGLLDLGKAWHALDVMLGEGKDPILGDAVLARSGVPFGPTMGFGRPRLLEPARVAQIASALAALPEDLVETRWARLANRDVHGGFGPKGGGSTGYDDELAELGDPEEDAERAALGVALGRLIALYRDAAARGDSLIAIVI